MELFNDLKTGDCIMKIGHAERESVVLRRTYATTFCMTFSQGEVLTIVELAPLGAGEYRLVFQRPSGQLFEQIISSNSTFATHFNHLFRKL